MVSDRIDSCKYSFDQRGILLALENFIETKTVIAEKSVMCDQIKKAVWDKLRDPDYKERLDSYEKEQLERGSAGEQELRRYAEVNNEVMKILTLSEILNKDIDEEKARTLLSKINDILEETLKSKEQRNLLNEMYTHIYNYLVNWITGVYESIEDPELRHDLNLIFVFRKWTNYFCKVEYAEPLAEDSVPNAIEIIEVKTWVRNMSHVASIKAMLNLVISLKGQVKLRFTTLNILDLVGQSAKPLPLFVKDLQFAQRYKNHARVVINCLKELLVDSGKGHVFKMIEKVFNALFPGAGGVIVFIVKFISCVTQGNDEKGTIAFT